GRGLRGREHPVRGAGLGAARGRGRAAAAREEHGPLVIGRYRWWIGALLFLSTVINYIDRQTLSVLAPHLKTEFGWSNENFAWIVIAFRVAYGGGQMFAGRLLDSIGTRAGLTLTVACYSAIAAL